MTFTTVFLGMLAVLGNTDTTGGRRTDPAPANRHETNVSAKGPMSLVSITHVGTWFGKPPFKRFDLDVMVRNPGPKPRWLFVPSTIGSREGGIREAIAYQLPGKPPACLWSLQGLGGGWAVRLGPGAEATLKGLGVAVWVDDVPTVLTIETMPAEEILVDGEPVMQWVGVKGDGLLAGEHDAHVDPMKMHVVRGRANPRGPTGLATESSMIFVGGRLMTASLAVVAEPSRPRPAPIPVSMPWPDHWSGMVGKMITVEGKAVDAKAGALLLGPGPGDAIWIDGIHAWPHGFYHGLDRGVRLRVTGEVIERGDLPVFEQKKGEPPKTGIPVPAGTSREQAGDRWLLKDATWTVLE